MVFTFLMGLAAGVLTPVVEPYVKQALENVALSKLKVEQSEMDVLTLVILLFLAAVVTGGGSAVALLLGALLGVFGKRLIAVIQGRGQSAGEDTQ